MVIHIFKDGTETTDLKDVHVPAEIVERIYNIVKEGEGNKKVQDQKRQHCG